jgi:hypothetical protein
MMIRKFGNCWLEYRDPVELISIHQIWRFAYAGIKKEPTISRYTILLII